MKNWKFNLDKTTLLSLNNKNEYVKVFDVNTGIEPNSKDATLIEAAPNMLEALETLCDKERLSFDALCLVKDVIRKARG